MPDGSSFFPPSGIGDGITQLTGGVTAGPSTGSAVATVVTVPTAATPALTGDVTKSAGSAATTLAAGSASNLNSGTLAAARLPALTGDVTTSAGSAATTLAAGSASNLNSGTLAAARLPALTGDVTTSAGSAATTLAAGSASVLNSGTLPAARLPVLTPLQMIAMGIIDASYSTPAINFLGTSSANVCVPACPGYIFQPVSLRPTVRTRTGATTGTLAYQLGNDVNESNLASGTTSGTNLTAQTAPFNPATTTSVLNVAGLAEATTGYTVKITGAATGSSVLTGYIVIFGTWLPV